VTSAQVLGLAHLAIAVSAAGAAIGVGNGGNDESVEEEDCCSEDE
jgi:hypothetical protein